MVPQSKVSYAAQIGIDWASQKHDYCLGIVGTESVELGTFGARPEDVAAWIGQLRTRFKGKKIALCLEQSKGALMHQLLSVDFIDLYPLNPQALSNYRKAFVVSRAKDDPTDAQLLWEYLFKHQARLRLWRSEDVHTRKLGLLVEDRRGLVNARAKLSNQLNATLKTYYPQALSLCGEKITSPLACDFLLRWSTLPSLKSSRPQTITTFYTRHHVRSQKTIDERLAYIDQSVPLVEDPAIVDTCVLKVQALVRQIVCLNQDINKYDGLIAKLFDTHCERALFDSLPGAGPALAPRLLVALGGDRDRFGQASELAAYVGIAPVTQRSGQRTFVHWRMACSKFLRQSFHEFANFSRKKSVWAQAYYECQRSKGKSHQATLRALAFKWIRIIYHCWKHHEVYDEAKYLAALVKRQSPLVQYIDQTA